MDLEAFASVESAADWEDGDRISLVGPAKSHKTVSSSSHVPMLIVSGFAIWSPFLTFLCSTGWSYFMIALIHLNGFQLFYIVKVKTIKCPPKPMAQRPNRWNKMANPLSIQLKIFFIEDWYFELPPFTWAGLCLNSGLVSVCSYKHCICQFCPKCEGNQFHRKSSHHLAGERRLILYVALLWSVYIRTPSCVGPASSIPTPATDRLHLLRCASFGRDSAGARLFIINYCFTPA